MTRLKHVLVLIILILPMFALVPSLVARPNEVLTNQAPVETALPAQFVQETLRVAVYAEDNTTLPAYASGGVSTAHHTNLIQFLESNGYAVTALSTADILDHQLMSGSFDAFVLVNNLPKDEIVDFVIEYWRGGGGILSFDSGMGFLYYHGMIVEGMIGNYALLGVDVAPHWGFDYTDNVTVTRHSTTKQYADGETFRIRDNSLVMDVIHLESANPTTMTTIFTDADGSLNSIAFALDNTGRKGGRIVQLTGNCSLIPAWESSTILDSIDWLAPRPKGRILVDMDHGNWIPIDPWDPHIEYYPLDTWRNSMVNHSYTVDKSFSALTPAKLAPYDMLVILMPTVNFTAAEVEAVRAWVMGGGSLFVIGDTPSLGNVAAISNYLISPFDISFNLTAGDTAFGATCVPTAELHPLHENAMYLEMGDGGFLNITGDAYPIWIFNDNIVGAGQEYGEGRVIVNGDGNMVADGLEILYQDNYQYLLNVANWLTAAKARVLVYADQGGDPRDPNLVPINGPVAQALNDLGLPFYMTSDIYYFNKSLFSQQWDLVVFDNIASSTSSYQHHLVDFVENGGKLIFSTYYMTSAIQAYFGIESYDNFDTIPPDVFFWDYAHPMFNLPAPYGLDYVESTFDLFGAFGTYALNFTTFANATTYAGYSASPDGGAAIIVSANGRVIIDGPLITCYGEDTDDSTYPDNFELWLNQIAYLYFERPNIDHPDDVTYMETETGNEITWTPTAPAGPWEYVFKVNGTPVQGGHWNGAPLTFNVDGINASITEYELTIFDRLGYSIFDRVTLNVTEYIAPPGPGFDPTLLIIIGAAVGGLLIVLVVLWKLKKK